MAVNLAMALVALALTLGVGAAWLSMAMPAWRSRIGDLTPLGAFREAVQDAWVGATPAAAHLLAMAVVAVVAGVTAPQTDAQLDAPDRRLDRAFRVAPMSCWRSPPCWRRSPAT